MTPLGDPVAVEELAAQLVAAAETATGVGFGLHSGLEAATFRSQRSAGFRERSIARRQGLESDAEEMRALALALRAHAGWIRSTVAEMRALEQQITGWASAHPTGSDPAGMDASIIPRKWQWPETGTLRWREIATMLRRRGVVF